MLHLYVATDSKEIVSKSLGLEGHHLVDWFDWNSHAIRTFGVFKVKFYCWKNQYLVDLIKSERLFRSQEKKKKKKNKMHSENADTSTSATFDRGVWPWLFVKVKKADVIRYRLLLSVTFDLMVWPWLFVKAKKANVIRCRLLYFTLVSGTMTMGLILYETSPFFYCMWPLTFICDLQLLWR